MCGIWQDDDDGVNINACCLSSGICSNESPSLAVVDSVGKLRMYNYPVPGSRDNAISGEMGKENRPQYALNYELILVVSEMCASPWVTRKLSLLAQKIVAFCNGHMNLMTWRKQQI